MSWWPFGKKTRYHIEEDEVVDVLLSLEKNYQRMALVQEAISQDKKRSANQRFVAVGRAFGLYEARRDIMTIIEQRANQEHSGVKRVIELCTKKQDVHY